MSQMSDASAGAPFNEARLNAFMTKAVGELGATFNSALVVLGDRLGIYKAMAQLGPCSCVDLAKHTGLHERYLREWLSAQAAGRFIIYDALSRTFTLPNEHALVLADSSSDYFLPGLFQITEAGFAVLPKLETAFRSGDGIGWHEQHLSLFKGMERISEPNYRKHLISEWLPALDGVVPMLERGARVADVGCGAGVSTLLMAEAYPSSEFFGFDYHDGSIALAADAAARLGLTNVHFEVNSSHCFAGENYDLITLFDCLHDMGDPTGVASRVLHALSINGRCMVVEPLAGDALEENLTNVGRLFYGASTLFCVPAVIEQGFSEAFGGQAGEAKLRETLLAAGFSSATKVADSVFHLVIEAQP